MDVRISYGIDFEKVPKKVAEMLRDTYNINLTEPVRLAESLLSLSGDNASAAAEVLDHARKQMAVLDRKLNDCQLILKGYVDAKNQSEEQEEGFNDAD